MSAPASSPTRSRTTRTTWTAPPRRSSRRPISNGSPDNLTVQIVRIDELPDGEASEVFGQASELPLPPLLEARMVFDGYRIVRELHGSSRSHIYLAVDTETDDAGRPQDPVDRSARRPGLSQALHDGGMGRAAHQQRPCAQAVPAVAKAQLSLCRHGIHRRPDPDPMDDRQSEAGPGNRARNRRADRQGAAGLPPDGDAASGHPAGQHHDRQDRNGEDHRFRLDQGARASSRRRRRSTTTTFSAPRNTPRRNISSAKAARSRSDIFSLGVITYQMLTGRLPYGAEVAKARTKIAAAQVAIRVRARRQPRDSGMDR